MLEIDNVMISQEVFTRKFCCDLSKCKGICCVEGDSGAPLDREEIFILEDIIFDVLPILPEQAQEAIYEQGVAIRDEDGDWVTPLVDGKECAYTVFDEKGIAWCGIEQLFFQGRVSFRKPISCQLYPIRVDKLPRGKELMLYHKWDICSDACLLGKSKGIPVYRFLKDPLVRKYGQEWYDMLCEAQKKLFPQAG